MDWKRIHVSFYDTDKDALILEAVRPLFGELTGQVDAVSFTRHWRQGPHLRLDVRTDRHTFDEVVCPAVRSTIGGFLAKHPSTRVLDPMVEHPAHQRLAELEADPGPLLPWYPDNSIQVVPCERREETLGNRETADLLSDFYADTTELAFRMIESARGPERLALGFSLMIATAHALSGADITRTFVSYRSHAEAFLCGLPEGAGLRPAWDEHYRKHAGVLVRRVHAVLATLAEPAGGRAATPLVQDWISAVRPYRGRALPLVRSGAVSMSPSGAWADDDLAELSPFHRRLYANSAWLGTRNSVDFGLYRLMLNLTYLTLTRIGITPAERFLLSHLVANAVEETYGISAIDLVGRVGAR